MLLVRTGSKNLFLPEFRTEVSVGSLQSMVHSLDKVTHCTGVTTSRSVTITDYSHKHKLLSCRGGNKSSTMRGRNETYTYGTRFSSYLTWCSVRHTSLTSPESTTYRSYIELSSSYSTSDSSCYLRGTLNNKTNMSVVISQSNERSLETTCTELQDKKLDTVGFLLELGYNLMITTDDNVSESPGFEPCLGIFGGSLWKKKNDYK